VAVSEGVRVAFAAARVRVNLFLKPQEPRRAAGVPRVGAGCGASR